MYQKSCELCEEPISNDPSGLCSKCHEMTDRIKFLIENHRDRLQKYFVENYTLTFELDLKRYDRRVKKYQPPLGIHTPERRTRIRRTMKLPNSPKRRKADFMP